MIRLARLYVWCAFVAILLFGANCATTRAAGTVAKACEPTAAQGMQILDAAASSPDQAVALAAIDGLGFALCVLQRGADEAIASLEPKPDASALAVSAASYSPALENLRAWRAAHP